MALWGYGAAVCPKVGRGSGGGVSALPIPKIFPLPGYGTGCCGETGGYCT